MTHKISDKLQAILYEYAYRLSRNYLDGDIDDAPYKMELLREVSADILEAARNYEKELEKERMEIGTEYPYNKDHNLPRAKYQGRWCTCHDHQTDLCIPGAEQNYPTTEDQEGEAEQPMGRVTLASASGSCMKCQKGYKACECRQDAAETPASGKRLLFTAQYPLPPDMNTLVKDTNRAERCWHGGRADTCAKCFKEAH